jgi:hypothetical protein
LALVKSQIWSPDQVDSCGGFQPFGHSELPGSSYESESGFQVSPEYLRDLMVDPHVKKHVESIVEERTKRALLKILHKYDWVGQSAVGPEELETYSLPELESQLQRLEAGLADRWKKELDDTEQRKSASEKAWEKILEEWTCRRDSLLRAHEKEWCRTLGYIIQKVHLKNSQKTLLDIESWMNQNMSEFLDRERVIIYLSRQDYELLKTEAGEGALTRKWSLMEDPQLEIGQIRFEAGNAGVIFDEKKNLERVLGWIENE